MADLFHRVSIRKFKDEAVSNEDIGYILEAAMAAPSAKNQQPWEFYVVENREVLKQLGESKIVGIPAGQRAFGVFALGYPDEERTQQDRFDQSRIHYVK